MILMCKGSGSLFVCSGGAAMRSVGSFGLRSMGIPWKWLQSFFSLLMGAALFHSCSFADAKPISDAEFQKQLLKAENGSLSAEVLVAKAYASGRTGKIDYEQAARWYRRAADQGDPDSQSNLGVLYLQGQGVARNEAEAMRWFQRAAASGYPLALHNLAMMYLRGWGVAADPEHGIELLMRSAGAGLEISQLNLGIAYLNGEAVPCNPELGIQWAKRAARHDLPEADFILGLAFENGEGAQADTAKATAYYRKAADRGYAAAQNNLGRLYLQGKGVKKDLQEAMRLFYAAAEQGNGQSYLNLALCSLIACDRVVDVPAAYAWYLAAKSAQAQSPPSLAKRFAEIAGEMSAEQIQRAESVSQAWIARHPAADPRAPLELGRQPGAFVAVNRRTRTSTNDEVLKTSWQQTPFMQPRLPSRDSER